MQLPNQNTPVGDRKESPLSLAVVFLLLTAPLSGVRAAEYYVNPAGSDAGNGQTRSTAFATIQKGVDTLEAGDTLIIGPGEYEENVIRTNLGATEKQTVIRAEIPGTAVLRGDVPAPEFKKVDGFRFVYSAHFDEDPLAVLEHDTLRVLVRKPDLGNIEFEPGTCYYDGEKKQLYISPSDLRSPAGRKYTVSVRKVHGLFLIKPTGVVVDGLVTTGYCAPGTGWHFITGRTWGIALNEPTNCVIRRCTTYFNYGGIAMDNGSGNQVDNCLTFGNMSYNILVFGGPENHDNIIENSYAYQGRSGMHFYGKLAGSVILRNNRAWGHELDYSNKCGNDDSKKFGLVERCIGLSNFQAHGLKHTIMGGLNEYDRSLEEPPNNILFAREKDLDMNHEFADPANLDFRLQADSRFREKTGQPDRGPFPYESTIYYLSTDGTDQNDGLSLRTAWRTFASALKKLKPGDTLYLEEGEYEADLTAGLSRVRILGRGLGRVVIRGPLTLENSTDVEFQRLLFTDSLSVNGGRNFIFKNCQFSGKNEALLVKAVQGILVSHCLFARNRLGLIDCSEATLTGNFFANDDGPALQFAGKCSVTYSDYNGYQNAAVVSETEGLAKSLKQVQAEGNEIHSLERNGMVQVANGLPEVQNTVALEGWGPMSSSLGIFNELNKPKLALAGPFIHSVSDTTANIEWWSSEPMAFELKWGDTPEMTQSVKIPAGFQYSGYSLTGLQKGHKYFVSLQPFEGPGPDQPPKPVDFQTTLDERDQPDFYVSADGNDSNTGLSKDKAFRTVAKASATAGAGSTVNIASGDYPEMVWIRATGTEERPVTFRSVPGNRVSVSAFSMSGKNHVNLDGIYTDHLIELLLSTNIDVTRCFSTGTLVKVRNCQRILIKNCVIANGFFSAMEIGNSADISIENNVILRPAINGAVISNQSDQKVQLSRNIFTDSIPFKSKIAYFEVARAESLVVKDNCFYMRTPDKEKDILVRMMFAFYGDEDYDRLLPLYDMRPASEQPSKYSKLTRVGLEEFEQAFDQFGSFFANPEFQGASDLHLEAGQRVTTKDLSEGYLVIYSDMLLGKKGLDFPDLFATNPEVVNKHIGLIPEDFKDFHFNQNLVTPTQQPSAQ